MTDDPCDAFLRGIGGECDNRLSGIWTFEFPLIDGKQSALDEALFRQSVDSSGSRGEVVVEDLDHGCVFLELWCGLGGGGLGWVDDPARHLIDEVAKQLGERAAPTDGLAG